ncbi:MAG: hypothetical protein OES24_17140 [Acidimicrobiia bacterium]|nr:hypothetical protein [Acidimicrobiia bacterium]
MPTGNSHGSGPDPGRLKPLRVPVWVVAVVILIAVGWFLAGGSIGVESGSIEQSGDAAATAIESRYSDLPVVAVGDLPGEARNTLALIAAGGPYPFTRDDSVFQNRERLLPLRDDGHYREYTVITPGEDDRGARRIVAGAAGEFYYTNDHYASFREIVGVGP